LGRSQKTQPLAGYWGLTGGAASGKSTVAKYFVELGIPVLDADVISRHLSEAGGAAHDEIVRRFGHADRIKLREIVFKDPSARKDLENILHPHIIRESQAELERLAQETGARVVLYEASLLVETGRYKSFDGLIVVDCPREIRAQRLITRNGISAEMADLILNAQTSDRKRREAATILIENSASLDELRKKVREIALAARWISS